MNQISDGAVKWLLGRGIDPETATASGVYTTMQDGTGEVIVFPFLERGQAVNEKFRARGKRFWQREGGKKTFWNHDAILDPALRDEKGTAALVITEGELDALSAIEAGLPLTVSVPDGAPQAARTDDIDPQNDAKFEYVWNCWDALKEVRRIVIATDDDGPGQALAQELVRRLGVDRCFFVAYPTDCKDLNDVLTKHGKDEVVRVITGARPYPVAGLYKLSEFPPVANLKTYSTGWPSLDEHFRPYLGEFVVLTGIPAHGKSTWASALAVNLCKEHGWPICFASFEMPPVPFHRDGLRQYLAGKPVDQQSEEELADGDAWVEANIVFIAQNPAGEEQDFDVQQILDLAKTAVVRHGIKVLIIDPFNELEHRRRQGELETEYIGRAIREFRRFARRYEVLVIVVCHPTKMGGEGRGANKPSLYDVSGSAHWFNKSDAGIVLWRPDIHVGDVEVDVKKVRFRQAGRPGIVRFVFDEFSGQFVERTELESVNAA